MIGKYAIEKLSKLTLESLRLLVSFSGEEIETQKGIVSNELQDFN